jgi:hypothetical protein
MNKGGFGLNGPARCVAERALGMTVAATRDLAALITARRTRRRISGRRRRRPWKTGEPA